MNLRRISLTSLLAFTLFSQGCMSTMVLETPDEVKTMKQARLIHGLGGAAIGAGAGAGIAALAGGDSSDIWKGAGIGAIAGGIAGTAQGTREGERVVTQKRVAKADEAYLTKSIANARKYNSALASYNSKLESQIATMYKNKDVQGLAAVRRQASGVLSDTGKEVSTREKFTSDPSNSAKKSEMASLKSSLASRRDRLQQLVARAKARENALKG